MKDLPEHLKELIQPTPSGVDKLLAAWDGLSVETQLLILSIINTKDYLLSAADDSAPDKIRIKALECFFHVVALMKKRQLNKRLKTTQVIWLSTPWIGTL